jgi:hypothetical protein
MAYQALLLGAVENDGTGDTLRVGGAKINSNFTELYDNFPVDYADITGAPTGLAFADLTGVPAFALLASPAFSGIPAAPTAAKATNTTQLATTAFVRSQLDAPTFTGVISAPTPANADNSNTVATTSFVKALGYAPIASPTFTGLPAAPTASLGNNTTQLATTAFVTATKVVIDNAIALKANLAAPVLTGIPTAPTAAPSTNTLQLATTAFVEAVRVVLNAAIALKSNIISPAFTGVPTAPTAAPGTNTTQLATTAFTLANVSQAYTESAETTFTNNATILIAHGLGVVPKDWHVVYRCKTAEDGYSVGDEINADNWFRLGSDTFNSQAAVDATNVVLTVSPNLRIVSKITRQNTAHTTANWRVVARWRL